MIDENGNIHFDYAIGNPPYQENSTGANADQGTADPIYHSFIDLGMKMSDYGSIICPGRFLFNAGKTPKQWNKKILSDPHFNVAEYSPKSGDYFRNVDIKGGYPSSNGITNTR